MFNVNEFKAELNKQNGLAQPNKFRMLITGGVLKNSRARALALLINRASIPGRGLATNEIRTHGPIRKMPYNSTYKDLQISVYCTNDGLFPRDLFMDWQNAIVDTTTGQVNYYEQYVSDIELETFDEEGNINFSCKFIDAYPVIVDEMSLDWGATNTYQNLNVTFTYRKWQEQPLPLSPFGNNLAINALYPNFDVGGAIDRFAVAAVSRADGQVFSGVKKAGQFLGNIF